MNGLMSFWLDMEPKLAFGFPVGADWAKGLCAPPEALAAGALPENGFFGAAFAAPPDDAAKGLADGGGRG